MGSWDTARDIAATQIARALAHDGAIHPGALVNTGGFKAFPPEVLAHDQSIGPYTYFPAVVLAKFACGRESEIETPKGDH